MDILLGFETDAMKSERFGVVQEVESCEISMGNCDKFVRARVELEVDDSEDF